MSGWAKPSKFFLYYLSNLFISRNYIRPYYTGASNGEEDFWFYKVVETNGVGLFVVFFSEFKYVNYNF